MVEQVYPEKRRIVVEDRSYKAGEPGEYGVASVGAPLNHRSLYSRFGVVRSYFENLFPLV
jgi:hypothetical protein